MFKQKGIALIPLIFGLLLIAAIPLTINQVQKNQNLQNRAALNICLSEGQKDCYQTPCCSNLICDRGICTRQSSLSPTPAPPQTNQVNCQEIQNLYLKYCQPNQSVSPPEISCQDIYKLISLYCR